MGGLALAQQTGRDIGVALPRANAPRASEVLRTILVGQRPGVFLLVASNSLAGQSISQVPDGGGGTRAGVGGFQISKGYRGLTVWYYRMRTTGGT